MTTTILKDDTVAVFFVLRVNGQTVSPRFSDRVAAEMARSTLPQDQQPLAEVVAVDTAGRQLLLG